MIAELHGKISRSGSNLNDRLEDNLTSDVFGTLRYLPFEMGMAQILKAARIERLTQSINQLNLHDWGDHIRFWPSHARGELDIFLEFDHAVVGIEIKYHSGLSSDDEVENDGATQAESLEESRNQLARESWIVKEWGNDQKPAYLILIAPDSACASICQNVCKRNILAPGVFLGYVSWQEILILLSELEPELPYQKLIRDDLVRLLKRKGFERFHTFELNDCADIDPDRFFSYDYMPGGFTFRFPHTVRKGDHYEYR